MIVTLGGDRTTTSPFLRVDVAATRGRDESLFCVVSDGADIAEARDVLDAILALDRADVRAVTQRRTLAEVTRGYEPARLPRLPRHAASSPTGSDRSSPSRPRPPSSLAIGESSPSRNHAVDQLRRIDTVNLLETRNEVVNGSRQVDAMETWLSWANGDDVTINHLADTVQTLAARGDRDGPAGLLACSIEVWADRQQVELAGLQLRTIPADETSTSDGNESQRRTAAR